MSAYQQESNERQAALRRKVESATGPDSASPVHPLLTLQSQIGNAQVARLLAQRAAPDDDQAQAQHDLAQREEDQEAVGIEGGPVGPDTAQRIDSARGGGSALDSGMRQSMESGFGTSFEDVRVHQDSESNVLANRLTAHAFTTGNDIFLRGDSNPSDSHLMAHELTHVVQQRSMGGGSGMSVGAAGDVHEQAADSTATAVLNGGGPATAAGTASAQRATDDENVEASHDLSVQRAGPDDEDLQASHDLSVQRAGPDDEDLQASHDLSSVQRAGPDDEDVNALHDLSLQRESAEEEQ